MTYPTMKSSTSINFNQCSIDYFKKDKRNQSRLKLIEIGEIAEQSIFFERNKKRVIGN